MKFLKRYNKVVTYKLKQPKDFVIGVLSKEKQTVQVSGASIKWLFESYITNSIAPKGTIMMTFTESNTGDTIIKCEITPRTLTEEGIYMLIFIFSFFSILVLLFNFTLNTFLVMVSGMIMLGLWMHFAQLLCRGKMEAYLSFKINSIRSMRYIPHN